jgi:hypothetical protein
VIVALSRPHPSRWGAPIVSRVDTTIFERRYFAECMRCQFCHDRCCTWGVDVDAQAVARIESHGEMIERYTGVPRARWFTGEWHEDPEMPGGRFTRTRVEEGACVFLRRGARGCALHAFALERGLDYHDLKPMVSALFPLTFDQGLLHAAGEIEQQSLVCAGSGETLYRAVRAEVVHYFGEELAKELDALERRDSPLRSG